MSVADTSTRMYQIEWYVLCPGEEGVFYVHGISAGGILIQTWEADLEQAARTACRAERDVMVLEDAYEPLRQFASEAAEGKHCGWPENGEWPEAFGGTHRESGVCTCSWPAQRRQKGLKP